MKCQKVVSAGKGVKKEKNGVVGAASSPVVSGNAVAMPPNFGGGFFGKRLCPRNNF